MRRNGQQSVADVSQPPSCVQGSEHFQKLSCGGKTLRLRRIKPCKCFITCSPRMHGKQRGRQIDVAEFRAH